MKKYLVLGVILLFVGLAISPSINADNDKLFIKKISDTDKFDYDGYTPIQLVFLLINKVHNYKDIQYIESEEDVLQIINSDAELNGIIEELKSYSCGCKEENIEFEWPFPVLCIFLLPFHNWGIRLYAVFNIEWFLEFMLDIGLIFNCWWAGW